MQMLCLVGVFALFSSANAGTLTYSNVSGSAFTFSQIVEVSAQNTFLGGDGYYYYPPTTPPLVAFQDSNGFDYIKFSPGALLTRSSSQGWPLSGSTKLSMIIGSSNSVAIPGAKIRLEGTARVREPQTNSTASFYSETALYLEVFGLTGTMQVPSTLSKTIQLNSVTHENPGLINWVTEWQSTSLESLFSDPVFNSPTMKVSKLSLSINPFFELTAQNQGYAEFYVNQLQVAIIPEPSASTLIVLGVIPLLLRRRRV